jgi:hypothetical protein
MREIDNLAIEITRNSITITKPHTGQHVTYSKDPVFPLLVAPDALRENLDAARAAFLAQAWKAAHATACRIGWLRS